MNYAIEEGDALEVLRGFPDGIIQCCVTSPPYWGLRDYGVEGQLGLEKTPEEYVAKLVAIFREVRRVLRDDGVLWLNLGDCYAGSGRGGYAGGKTGLQGSTEWQDNSRVARGSQIKAGLHKSHLEEGAMGRAWVPPPPPGLKNKDLVGIPWMVAFALRADGWYLRSDVIWHKPNPMPESTRGRPTKSHEYVFLLSKSKQYFFDDEAIAEDAVSKPQRRPNGHTPRAVPGLPQQTFTQSVAIEPEILGSPDGKRHVRSVWTVPTVGYKEAHFATMSPQLARMLVASGSSERGACCVCFTPWQRILKRNATGYDGSKYGERAVDSTGGAIDGGTQASTLGSSGGRLTAQIETLGWEPGCECGEEKPPIPCLVLDPFNGAGTTGLVSVLSGRDYVGIELNPEYAAMARKRIDCATAKDAAA